jgi:hypothetical protein
MKRMMAIVGGVALALVTGCTGVARPRTTALDGHAFRVTLASDRGGAPDVIEMRFANGALEASDAQLEGAVAAGYVVQPANAERKTSFEAETRAPGAVRRFRGTVDGTRIDGNLELSRDGAPPARYTFRGEAI